MDIVYIGALAGFTALCLAFAAGCDSLGGK
jgi:hypothetical protein